METEEIKKNEKNEGLYICKQCDFYCSYMCDWRRHCSTRKHIVSQDGNNMEIIGKKKTREFSCNCGRIYATNSGLWKHEKKCPKKMSQNAKNVQNNIQLTTDFKITTEMFYELLNQNKELQNKIIDISSEKQQTMFSNCGNNNKTFNLQIYLNETCKDALNINEFVDQIQLTVNDLEETGKLGYAEGISRVFINNLDNLDYTSRPIHCCDFKRETLYIKDSNQWHKEDKNKTILTKAIKQVANKNIKQITEWQKLHPQYNNPKSKQNDKYMQIVLNSMSGSTKEECEKNYQKIIKNVIKKTVIDKTK